MLDCDEEGQSSSRQAVYELAKHCRGHLARPPPPAPPGTAAGRFRGRPPESLDVPIAPTGGRPPQRWSAESYPRRSARGLVPLRDCPHRAQCVTPRAKPEVARPRQEPGCHEERMPLCRMSRPRGLRPASGQVPSFASRSRPRRTPFAGQSDPRMLCWMSTLAISLRLHLRVPVTRRLESSLTSKGACLGESASRPNESNRPDHDNAQRSIDLRSDNDRLPNRSSNPTQVSHRCNSGHRLQSQVRTDSENACVKQLDGDPNSLGRSKVHPSVVFRVFVVRQVDQPDIAINGCSSGQAIQLVCSIENGIRGVRRRP